MKRQKVCNGKSNNNGEEPCENRVLEGIQVSLVGYMRTEDIVVVVQNEIRKQHVFIIVPKANYNDGPYGDDQEKTEDRTNGRNLCD